MKKFWGLLIWGICTVNFAATVQVNPSQAEIVVAPTANAIVKFAGQELQKHLQLVTGVKLPITSQATAGKYQFHLTPPRGGKLPLAYEEARIAITPQAAYIYGDDDIKSRYDKFKYIFNRGFRTGTLFAVYEFLERDLGIRWLEPGDNGIVYTPRQVLSLTIREYAWKPAMIQRTIRDGFTRYRNYVARNKVPHLDFLLDEKTYDARHLDTEIWLKRHKIGSNFYLPYGHSFTQWWQKYGKTHPEYFAMQKDGVRRPEYPRRPTRSKMCVSNRALHAEIVRQGGSGRFLNICENDSGGFCRCPACQKLDVRLPGEKFGEHLSDRYVWFANEVEKKAAQINPQVQAVFYAYGVFRYPPRRTKVDPRVIAGFVPSMLNLAETEKMYQEWQKMGLKNIFLRPNDHHVSCGLPMGYEKQLFDAFQLGIKYGIMGIDYDSLHNFWPTTGLADYILARAQSAPGKSFEHWEQEFCATYGSAAPEIRAYYRYWRTQVWEKRILPDRRQIVKAGRYGNFRRGVMWRLKNYYRSADFAATDQILQQAAAHANLTAFQRRRVKILQLANQHARLTYEAIVAPNQAKVAAGKKLLNFRLKYRSKLNFNWAFLVALEQQFGDITGLQLAAQFKDFSDSRPLDISWYFRIDPENIGLKQKWQTLPDGAFSQKWDGIKINTNWENQRSRAMRPELRKQLKNYDGIGWYGEYVIVPKSWRGKQIFLYFGGVDESAQVYLNGQFAGEHQFLKPDDWKTPFTIRIDHLINFECHAQNLVVRVKDTGGAGGIWRPVYLVCREP